MAIALSLLCVVLATTSACTRPLQVTTPTPVTGLSPDGVWQFVAEHPGGSERPNPVGPFAIVRFNRAAFERLLRGAPREQSPAVVSAVILTLPLPDATFARFRVTESPIVAPELSAAYPEIRTYLGQGVDDRTATVRFGWTASGFHALVLGAAEVYIDPYTPGDLEYCITMSKAK